jgi:hypothetical protein
MTNADEEPQNAYGEMYPARNGMAEGNHAKTVSVWEKGVFAAPCLENSASAAAYAGMAFQDH